MLNNKFDYTTKFEESTIIDQLHVLFADHT